MAHPQALGKLAEQVVMSLLSGAKWNNEFKEGRQYYDILWQGIKIDVKGCSSHYSDKSTFVFTPRVSMTGNKDVVFVLVGFDSDNYDNFYLWVTNPFDMKAHNYTPLSLKDSKNHNDIKKERMSIEKDKIRSRIKKEWLRIKNVRGMT